LSENRIEYGPPLSARPLTSEAGVSILEVVAMLAILSISMLPMLNLYQQIQRNAVAVENRIEEAEQLQNALEYLRAINVGQNPNGTFDFGKYALSWTAALAGEDTRFPQSTMNYQRYIGLYDVSFSITPNDDPSEFSISSTVRLVGWTPFVERNDSFFITP
jgi:Tfp pilus assembly protein FimT